MKAKEGKGFVWDKSWMRLKLPIIINGDCIISSSNYKDLNLLTFVESLVFFVSPSACSLAHGLGCCQIFLVSTNLECRLHILIRKAAQFCGLSSVRGATAQFGFSRSSHLTWTALYRTFLWTQLFRERRFIPSIRVDHRWIVLVNIDVFACVFVRNTDGTALGLFGILVALRHRALGGRRAKWVFVLESQRRGVDRLHICLQGQSSFIIFS